MASYYRLRQVIEQEPRILGILAKRKQPILCRRRESDRQKFIPINQLHNSNPDFYKLDGSKWEYFIRKDVVDSIRYALDDWASGAAMGEDDEADLDAKEKTQPDGRGVTPRSPGGSSTDMPNFGEDYERIKALEKEERLSELEESSNRLHELRLKRERSREETAEALVDTAKDAALINRASVLEAIRMGNEEATDYTENIVTTTQELVRHSLALVDDEIFDDQLVRDMIARSNGTVVQHMTRVYLNGLSFMLWYNRQLLTSSLVNRVRIDFARSYAKTYRKLLPTLHPESVTLERVFLGGMQALTEQQLSTFATGFLVHDVGKVEDIEYHEGDEGYDRQTVERHVKLGYTAVMNKTNYPREAGLITGYHHEYYGHPSGYGYFREFLERYRQANPQARIEYVMSYQMEPLIDYLALAFFPAKVLEVVDVFDSLTDPNRKYRSPLSKEEAISVMKEQFLEKNLKLDPILFSLFRRFSGL
ncbi:MAG: metal-dependent phosphohydrolase [Spirochaetes bacterium]|nr:metal-dependent phosphohydrolase [Spirochaetota bacterium]